VWVIPPVLADYSVWVIPQVLADYSVWVIPPGTNNLRIEVSIDYLHVSSDIKHVLP